MMEKIKQRELFRITGIQDGEEMMRKLEEQLARDYNCHVLDFRNIRTLVTSIGTHPERRKFGEDSILSILSYKGKLVISCAPELRAWCENVLAKNASAEWIFDVPAFIDIEKKLNSMGHTIDFARPFYVPDPSRFDVIMEKHISPGLSIHWLDLPDINAYEGDPRVDEAFMFVEGMDNALGLEVLDARENVIAVGGASGNSDRMWELGVNSFVPGKGYAATAISMLARKSLHYGVVPYAQTAMSHLASQKVMLKAGFIPMFCEMRSCPIEH